MNAPVKNSIYRCPVDLVVTPTQLQRVLVIGSCLTVAWPELIKGANPGCPCDFLLVNNRSTLPDNLPESPDRYDFQLVQLPLRVIVPDHSYFRLSHSDVHAYQRLFSDAKERLSHFLAAVMKWNVDHGMLTFVSNFLVPQQNPMGRLVPRYDFRNFVYFVEKVNEALAEELTRYNNAHLLDFDQIVSTLGRRFFQDDVVYASNHAAVLSAADFKLDQHRLEAVGRIEETYPRQPAEYLSAAWAEVVAMYRSIRQIDLVKLVIVDIDDTLWRGVAAEGADVTPQLIDGWPNGFVEALCYLRRRGVLLAVVSKNDENVVIKLWPRIFGGRLNLNDFVVRKINWRPKADNVEELLGELNLLPRNVVFIDDNPVEREAVRAAFPDIRTFGPNPYVWRRILLWSAETQSAGITSESAARTDMVRAQVQRESHRKKVSREEFLATLDLRITLSTLESVEQPSFQRAMELINKTNQFNTTGKRWTQQECQAAFGRGTRFYAFQVLDRFTEYGVVGVVITSGSIFEQFVMSCRVVGMDVEIAVLAELLKLQAENGGGPSIAVLRETELNLLCRDLYKRCGFERKDAEIWVRPATSLLVVPSHAHLSWIQSDGRDSMSGSKMQGQLADALAVR